MARKKDATKTKQLLAEAEEHGKQQQKLDKELEKQMDFAQKLVTDKVRFVDLHVFAGGMKQV